MKHILVLLILFCHTTNLIAQHFEENRQKEGFATSYINVLKESAQEGFADSQYLYGKCLILGDGVHMDKTNGFTMIKEAANQSHILAIDLLAWCFEYGIGTKKNPQESYKLYAKLGKDGQGNYICAKEMNQLKREFNIEGDFVTESAKEDFSYSHTPLLTFLPQSIKFHDTNNNQAIDANENCSIDFTVKNIGKGDAYNCLAEIVSEQPIKGVSLNNFYIKELKHNETKQISIPINASKMTEDGIAHLKLYVDEPHGFGTDTVTLAIDTKKFNAPEVKIVDYSISTTNGNIIQKKVPFTLQMLLQNIKEGIANNVTVSIDIPDNVYLTDGNRDVKFDHLEGGKTEKISYSLVVSNNYKNIKIPIRINIREKYGEYAQGKILNLVIGNNQTENYIIKAIDSHKDKIEIAALSSDVDKNIPLTNEKANSTFAVIIANEIYNKEGHVIYAVNDGNAFKEYCRKTLGLPITNIHYVANATLNEIKHEIKWLQDVIAVYNGDAKVIFYYAGHGIPDEQNKSAYLLPIDGYGSDVTTGYALEDLYKTLGSLPSKSVTVFLDACFSGAKRDGDMLASARGVAIKVKQAAPIGNMVVFTAAQGDETAYPYKEQGHGLFTYYLLKKLQESKGNTTLGELGDYIKTQVERQSIVTNGKLQSPSIMATSSIGNDWKKWTLNK